MLCLQIFGRKKFPPCQGREGLDYSERYAVEPTVSMEPPSLKKVGCCNKVFFLLSQFLERKYCVFALR